MQEIQFQVGQSMIISRAPCSIGILLRRRQEPAELKLLQLRQPLVLDAEGGRAGGQLQHGGRRRVIRGRLPRRAPQPSLDISLDRFIC